METIIIRTSDRSNFKRCRQKWDWSSPLRDDLQPQLAPQVLEFGTAIHAGLEAYYDPNSWGSSIMLPSALASFEKSCLEQKDKYKKALEIEGVDDSTQRDFDAELELGDKMLRHYAEWAPEHDNFTPIRVEVEFEIELGILTLPDGREFRIVYQGKIDLIAETEYGYVCGDHKTAAQFGSTDWMEIDDQKLSYPWAVGHMLGLDIRGFFFNRLLKDAPSPPERLQKERQGRNFSVNRQMRCTADLYERTLIEAGEPLHRYYEHIEYLRERGNPFFQRIPFKNNSHQYSMQQERILDEVYDMLNDPRIYTSAGPFTCMGCWFKAPCLAKSEGADYQFLLDVNYKKREDDND